MFRQEYPNPGHPAINAVIVRYYKITKDEEEKVSGEDSDEGVRKEIFSH